MELPIIICLILAVALGVSIWFGRRETKRLRSDVEVARLDLEASRGETRAAEEMLHAQVINYAKLEPLIARCDALEAQVRERGSRIEMLTAERSGFEAEAQRIPGLERACATLRDEVLDLKTENTRLNTEMSDHDRAHHEKVTALVGIRDEIEKNLKVVTADSLRENQQTFLKLANETFERHRTSSETDLELRQKAVQELVAPLQDSLKNYQEQIAAIERHRLASHGSLSAELKNVIETQNAVRAETAKLTNALRAAPKTRGRWGEQTLRNVLELSGLSVHCDYTEEEQFKREGSSLRPDVVIRLPGNRTLVVDAKTSLSAYLDAFEAVEEVERDRLLGLHANQVRSHVRLLSGKAYWDGLTETPDFVVMFVPGENFYAAALERDPALFEDAVALKVIIVTPATLIALAKAIAFGWRQEKVAENARKVHELGQELYRRIVGMAGHVTKFGSSLEDTVNIFNGFVGSMERYVLPQARRFRDLEVEGTTNEIGAIEQIDVLPRELRAPDLTGQAAASSEAEKGTTK